MFLFTLLVGRLSLRTVSASLPLLNQDIVLGMLQKFLVLKGLLFPKNEEISKKKWSNVVKQVGANKIKNWHALFWRTSKKQVLKQFFFQKSSFWIKGKKKSFSMQSLFSFTFKFRLSGQRGVRKNRRCWNKKKLLKNSVELHKNWGKKCKFRF